MLKTPIAMRVSAFQLITATRNIVVKYYCAGDETTGAGIDLAQPLSVPNANDDIGDDNKIIIELVRAPKRED